MLAVHHVNAFLVIAVCAAASVAAFVARRRGAGGASTHVLALAQTLVVAQVLFGLLLLAEHKRAADRLHYAYGTFAAACALRALAVRTRRSPRPPALVRVRDPACRCARRPCLHDGHMRRISPFWRGMGLLALARGRRRRPGPGAVARNRCRARAVRILHRDRVRRLPASGATSGGARSGSGRPSPATGLLRRGRALPRRPRLVLRDPALGPRLSRLHPRRRSVRLRRGEHLAPAAPLRLSSGCRCRLVAQHLGVGSTVSAREVRIAVCRRGRSE